jgi:hypothetical protein
VQSEPCHFPPEIWKDAQLELSGWSTNLYRFFIFLNLPDPQFENEYEALEDQFQTPLLYKSLYPIQKSFAPYSWSLPTVTSI